MRQSQRRGTFPQLSTSSDLRYTTGISSPVPVFGHKITQTSSRPPVGATRNPELGPKPWGHRIIFEQCSSTQQTKERDLPSELRHPNDIFRNAKHNFRPSRNAPFIREASEYHEDEYVAYHARKTYWDNSERSSIPYNKISAQDAEWAAGSTQREKESRKRYMEDYVGYDDLQGYKGHLRRIKVLQERENEMNSMAQSHSNWKEEEERGSWAGGWHKHNEDKVKRAQNGLLNHRSHSHKYSPRGITDHYSSPQSSRYF